LNISQSLSEGIDRVAFSPDGKILAGVNDKYKVGIWSFPEGELKTVLDGNINQLPKKSFFKKMTGLLSRYESETWHFHRTGNI